MEEISSSRPDSPKFSAEFPLKSKLCLFCVEPISTSELIQENDKGNSCNFNCKPDLISQSTFLQAIGLLCDFYKVDQRFGRVEQWALFGVDNFVNFLCCGECAIVVQKLVKLHQLILETQASLKSELETLANQIIISSFTITREYSINTCVQFREEIINNYSCVSNENINKTAHLRESQPPTQNSPTATTRKRPSTRKAEATRPMPLSKKRTSSRHHQNHTSTPPIHIPESFIKLERLDLSTFSKAQCQDSLPNYLDDINEEPPSPPISIHNDPITEDFNDNNSDADYEPIPTRTHRRGKGHSKRGRPPKSKSPNKRGRPPTKATSKVKAETVGGVDDQDYVPPKESSEDDEDDTTPIDKNVTLLPQKIKRGPGRPLKVGSRLYRSLHNQEGPVHKPIYLLPPSPSTSSTLATPHNQLLMYFNVPFQKTPDFLLCLHPTCTFSCPLSFYSPSQQTAYTTMRFHIRHLHRIKSSPSPQNYFCHLCSTHFDKRLAYLHHRKALHWTTPSPPVLCQVCDATLQSTSHLLKHLPSHKSSEELSIIKSPTRRSRKVDPLQPLSHPCDQCSKSFKCFTELRTHKITHIPLEIRRQHQCDQCGEKFINHNTLKGHQDRVHLKTMSLGLECRYCARKFFSKERSKYEAHLRTHTGEKPYQCAECGKGFHQKWNLTMHERLHGEDTVTCEFCSTAFKTQKYLRRHQRKHHKESVPQPDPKDTQKYKNVEHTENFIGPKLMFPCEPCQHVYRFKSILVSHLKRMHQMNYEKSEEFPNMWTFEDEGWVVNGSEVPPPPPGGGRGRVKKSKVKKEHVEFVYHNK